MKKSTIFRNYEWYSGRKRVFVHIVFWLVIFYVLALQSSFSIKKYDWVFLLYTSRQLLTIAAIHYFFSYYVIPKQLIKGRIITFLTLSILSIVFMMLSMYYIFYFFDLYNITPPLLANLSSYYIKDPIQKSLLDPVKIYNTILFHNVLFFTVLIKMTKEFFVSNIQKLHLENENIKLEKENIKLELNFLKQQIHPHFFFNTLNNIYSLITGKDDYAADIVLRLSDLMRYSLYESNNDKIALKRELDFIADYVELEKIRHNEHVSITIKITGEPKNFEIPPLVLITFVENAFKHGVNNSIDASWVKILIQITDSELLFSIKNSKPTKLQGESVDGGIGIVNVKRRLDLMYANVYQLKIKNEPLQYIVNLKIQMNGKLELHNSGRRTISTGSY